MEMREVMARENREPDEPRVLLIEAGRGRRRRASSGSSPSAGRQREGKKEKGGTGHANSTGLKVCR